MTDSIHQQLLGHLLGALDDEEQAWVDGRLERDESCRRELILWRRRLSPLEAMRPDFDPPPGLDGRTCRMVAAYGSAPARSARRRLAMSPDPTVPGAVSLFGWHDVAALGALLLTAVALLLPAIDASRFHAAVASCQDNLRQFGLAMTQYSRHHGEAMTQLAGEGKLTTAGIAAADLLGDAVASVAERNLCPEAWLAAQGATCVLSSPLDGVGVVPPIPGTAVPGYFFASTSNDWSGMWRDGTMDGHGSRLPAILALFADDPSADLPGRRLVGHDGRGRNLFFEDGRVRFVPCSTHDESAETVFSSVEPSAPTDVSAPIIYVNRLGR
ncbi:MAG: hypothetical protein KKE86_02695 [Planctomycetes bacterium]|nr:hypothetical protein [Planctomycetota bacterium]MBU4398225.1 hypothetical protein [Planctomycetota bacterium]MCG2683943.1 hypothetical protein [Planctomycetales bacterium]